MGLQYFFADMNCSLSTSLRILLIISGPPPAPADLFDGSNTQHLFSPIALSCFSLSLLAKRVKLDQLSLQAAPAHRQVPKWPSVKKKKNPKNFRLCFCVLHHGSRTIHHRLALPLKGTCCTVSPNSFTSK